MEVGSTNMLIKIQKDLAHIDEEVLPSFQTTITQIHDLRINLLKVKAHLKKLRDEKSIKTSQEFASKKLKIERNLSNHVNEYVSEDTDIHHYHHHHHHNHHQNLVGEETEEREKNPAEIIKRASQSYDFNIKSLLDILTKSDWSIGNIPLDKIHLDHDRDIMPLISHHLLECGITDKSLWDHQKYPSTQKPDNVDKITWLQQVTADFKQNGDAVKILHFLTDLVEKLNVSTYDQDNRFLVPRTFPYQSLEVLILQMELVQAKILFYKKNNKREAMQLVKGGMSELANVSRFVTETDALIADLGDAYKSFDIVLNSSYDNTMGIRSKKIMNDVEKEIEQFIQIFKELYCYTYDTYTPSLIQECCYYGIFTLLSIENQFSDRQFLAFKKTNNFNNMEKPTLDNKGGNLEQLYTWFEDQDIDFEMDMPKSMHRFHTNFVCPIEKAVVDPTTDPAKALKCGHILSSQSISQMVTFHSIKCPYCTAHTTEKDLQSLQFYYL